MKLKKCYTPIEDRATEDTQVFTDYSYLLFYLSGTTHRDASASDTTPVTVKMRAGQERKTRKSTTTTLLKKKVLGPSGKASRIENSSARLLVSHGEHRGVSSAAVDSNRKEKASLFNNSVFVTPMDINEPLNTPPPPLNSMATLEPALKDSTSTSTSLSNSTTVPSSGASAVFAVPDAAPASNMDKKQEPEQTQGFKEQLGIAALVPSNQPTFLSPVQVELNNTPTLTADLPHMSISSGVGDAQPVFTLSVTPESASSTSASTAAPFTATPCSPTSASTSATLTATPVSSTPDSPSSSSSCAPVGAAPDPPSTNHTAPSKASADSNIVSLKIIISDNQEESSCDPAPQAISSISRDKIPTIYLSSPAKSPGGPGAPKANLDEAAQAVSGLQSSEVHASPLGSKAGAVMASPLIGASQLQQNYIIQLPLDTTTPAVQGATASYFLVTEPPTTDAQTRQVLLSAGVSKGQPLPNKHGVTTPTHSQGYSTGKRA